MNDPDVHQYWRELPNEEFRNRMFGGGMVREDLEIHHPNNNTGLALFTGEGHGTRKKTKVFDLQNNHEMVLRSMVDRATDLNNQQIVVKQKDDNKKVKVYKAAAKKKK